MKFRHICSSFANKELGCIAIKCTSYICQISDTSAEFFDKEQGLVAERMVDYHISCSAKHAGLYVPTSSFYHVAVWADVSKARFPLKSRQVPCEQYDNWRRNTECGGAWARRFVQTLRCVDIIDLGSYASHCKTSRHSTVRALCRLNFTCMTNALASSLSR